MRNQGSVFVNLTVIDVDGERIELGHRVSNMEHMVSIPEIDVATFTIDNARWWDVKDELLCLKKGNRVEFSYGYRQGDTSPLYTGKIFWCNTHYDEQGCREVLRVAPEGSETKYGGSDRIWRDMTASQIAEEIAAKYGIVALVDPTTRVYSNLAQGNESDLAFLRRLASMEKGMYNVYFTSSAIVFKRIGTYKKSKYLFDLSQPDHSIVSITFDWQEVTKNDSLLKHYGKDGNILVEDVIEDVKSLADDVAPKIRLDGRGATTTVTPPSITDLNSARGIAQNIKKGIQVAKPLITGVQDSWAKSALAQKTSGTQKIQELTANLKVVGFPSYVKDEVLTIRGVKSTLEGNYWIQAARHNISVDSGYVTTFELNRNGLKYDKDPKSMFEELVDFFAGENKEEKEPDDAPDVISLDGKGAATTVTTPTDYISPPQNPLPAPPFKPEIEGNITD